MSSKYFRSSYRFLPFQEVRAYLKLPYAYTTHASRMAISRIRLTKSVLLHFLRALQLF